MDQVVLLSALLEPAAAVSVPPVIFWAVLMACRLGRGAIFHPQRTRRRAISRAHEAGQAWRARQGSNLQPPASKAGALSVELRARPPLGFKLDPREIG